MIATVQESNTESRVSAKSLDGLDGDSSKLIETLPKEEEGDEDEGGEEEEDGEERGGGDEGIEGGENEEEAKNGAAKLLEEAWMSAKAAQAKARAIGADLGKEMNTVTEFVTKIKVEIEAEKAKLAEARNEQLKETTSVHAHAEEEANSKVQHQKALDKYLVLACTLTRRQAELNASRIRLGTLTKSLKGQEKAKLREENDKNGFSFRNAAKSANSANDEDSLFPNLDEEFVLAMGRLSVSDPDTVASVELAREELKDILTLLQDTKTQVLAKERVTLDALLNTRARCMEKVDFWNSATKFIATETKRKLNFDYVSPLGQPVPSTADHIRELKRVRGFVKNKLSDTRSKAYKVVDLLLKNILRRYTNCREKIHQKHRLLEVQKPYGAPESDDLAMLDRLVEMNAKKIQQLRPHERDAGDGESNATATDFGGMSPSLHKSALSQSPFINARLGANSSSSPKVGFFNSNSNSNSNIQCSPHKPPSHDKMSSFKSPRSPKLKVTSPSPPTSPVHQTSSPGSDGSSSKKKQARPGSVGTNRERASPPHLHDPDFTTKEASESQIKEIHDLLRQHSAVESKRAKMLATRNGLQAAVDRQAAALVFATQELSNSGLSSAFTDREVPAEELVRGARPHYHNAVTVQLCGSQKCNSAITSKPSAKLFPAYVSPKKQTSSQLEAEDEGGALEAYALSIGKEAVALEVIVNNIKGSLFSKEVMDNIGSQSEQIKATMKQTPSERMNLDGGGSDVLSLHAPSLVQQEPSLFDGEDAGAGAGADAGAGAGAGMLDEESVVSFPSHLLRSHAAAATETESSYFFASTQLGSSSGLNDSVLSQFANAGLVPLLELHSKSQHGGWVDGLGGVEFKDEVQEVDSDIMPVVSCVAAARVVSGTESYSARRVIITEDMAILHKKFARAREEVLYSDW